MLKSTTIAQDIARLPWGVRGALLAGGCLLVTLVSPVMRYSCERGPDGGVGCVVSRQALGVVPYAWTTVDHVVDAESSFVPGGRDRSRRGRPIILSETVNTIHGRGRSGVWTTSASMGADPGTIAIAIDEMVAGRRVAPLLAWQANTLVALGVFVGALPFAAAMIGRAACERLSLPRDRWGALIERSYVAALIAGSLLTFLVFWGEIPLAGRLGLPGGG